MLTVNEVFHSIQGESTRAGLPCVFVRLTACNLRCAWCDTPYAFTEGTRRTVDEVVREVEAFGCPLVEITGGEPLLQPEVYPLMERLLGAGFQVMVETGGQVGIERLPPGVVCVLDVKCPGSGESHRMDWRNLARLRPGDEVKFVVRDRDDYDFARRVIEEHGLGARPVVLLMSPVHQVLAAKDLAAWILADRLPVRLQLQVHKYIWGETARGV